MKATKTMGLRQLIKDAPSIEVIDSLLTTGSAYTDATDKTRRKWENTAQRRKNELAKPAKAKANNKKKTKKGKGNK
tara:strand:- start:1708 stop:1935 length:228 start_codon:yes stop_codon:yes gene_type:complete